MTTVLETHQLTKHYGHGRLALDHLDLAVGVGDIFGYLGPNGAGKTTTIKLLLDLIRPTEGRAEVFGLNVRQHSVEVRRRIGFLPAELELWKGETGRSVIRHFARIHGLRGLGDADDLMQRLDFDPTKRIRTYSTGNRRKLGLVLALMHRPDLIVLDEPTSGLDPLLQQTFIALMREAKARGQTVFLSSHQLGEVQAICDQIAVLRGGQLVMVGTVDEVVRGGAAARTVYAQVRGEPVQVAALVDGLGRLTGASAIAQPSEGQVQWQWSGEFDPLLRALSNSPVYITDLHMSDPTLEDAFMHLYTGAGNGAVSGTAKVGSAGSKAKIKMPKERA